MIWRFWIIKSTLVLGGRIDGSGDPAVAEQEDGRSYSRLMDRLKDVMLMA